MYSIGIKIVVHPTIELIKWEQILEYVKLSHNEESQMSKI
jgi:hypothetical protein